MTRSVGSTVEDLVADGVDEMGLPQADAAVDEERVVVVARLVGDRLGRRVGELVARADDEVVEGVLGQQRRAPRRGLSGRCGGGASGKNSCCARRGHGQRQAAHLTAAQTLHGAFEGVETAVTDDVGDQLAGRLDDDGVAAQGHRPQPAAQRRADALTSSLGSRVHRRRHVLSIESRSGCQQMGINESPK